MFHLLHLINRRHAFHGEESLHKSHQDSVLEFFEVHSGGLRIHELEDKVIHQGVLDRDSKGFILIQVLQCIKDFGRIQIIGMVTVHIGEDLIDFLFSVFEAVFAVLHFDILDGELDGRKQKVAHRHEFFLDIQSGLQGVFFEQLVRCEISLLPFELLQPVVESSTSNGGVNFFLLFFFLLFFVVLLKKGTFLSSSSSALEAKRLLKRCNRFFINRCILRASCFSSPSVDSSFLSSSFLSSSTSSSFSSWKATKAFAASSTNVFSQRGERMSNIYSVSWELNLTLGRNYNVPGVIWKWNFFNYNSTFFVFFLSKTRFVRVHHTHSKHRDLASLVNFAFFRGGGCLCKLELAGQTGQLRFGGVLGLLFFSSCTCFLRVKGCFVLLSIQFMRMDFYVRICFDSCLDNQEKWY